jgi:hypothetical protein
VQKKFANYEDVQASS